MDVANRPPQHADLGAQDARQGVKTGRMRWVLVIGTVLAALAMLLAWGSFRHRPAGQPAAGAQPPEAPVLQRDQTPAQAAPTSAAPQSSQPLP